MLIVFTITSQGQNKLLSSIYDLYDGSSWKFYSGNNYEYDSNNNLITDTFVLWNGLNWQYSGKDSYVYNTNNKSTQNIYQNWNSATKQYDNSHRALYYYSISGDLEEILEENWNGSQWINDYKTILSYNSNNLINNYISYIWDGSQWVSDSRGTLTYNSNNKIVGSLDEEWKSSSWVYSYRAFLTYNDSNQIMTYINEIWNGNSWDNDFTHNYNFDSNGNKISFTESYNDGKTKTEYNYDTSVRMSNFVHPFKDKTGIDYVLEGFPYVNKLLNEIGSIDDNGSFVNSSRITYNYDNSIVLSTENFKTNSGKVKIFPNPSKDFIQVLGLSETENYEVYSIVGAKVNDGVINNNEKINIQNLTNGFYFFKFKDGKILKFIKE